jgi:hypothetical protein
MKWLIQISVMAGDLALIAAAGYLIYRMPFNLVIWFILYLVYKQWKKDGGFEAWDPKVIGQFFRNAKAIGL